MENPGDPALEERPDILDPISVDVLVLDVGLTMIDGLMDKLGTVDPEIGAELISMNLRAVAYAVADKVSKGGGLDVFYGLEADFT